MFPDDGTVIYTPTPGYVGPDSFVYWAQEDDPDGLDSDNATMHITVTAPPVVFVPTPIPVGSCTRSSLPRTCWRR